MASADLYSDTEAGAAPPASAPPETEEAPAEEQEEYSSSTAELPKSVLGGKNLAVGDELVLRIVQMGENSVVVEPAESAEAETATPETTTMPEQAPMPGSMAEMMG